MITLCAACSAALAGQQAHRVRTRRAGHGRRAGHRQREDEPERRQAVRGHQDLERYVQGIGIARRSLLLRKECGQTSIELPALKRSPDELRLPFLPSLDTYTEKQPNFDMREGADHRSRGPHRLSADTLEYSLVERWASWPCYLNNIGDSEHNCYRTIREHRQL